MQRPVSTLEHWVEVQRRRQAGQTPQQELGDRSRVDTSNTISQFGSTYATLAGGGTLYVVGRLTHNDHLAETGRLGTAAVIDASLIAEALKLATNRERPNEGNGTGGFWPHGTRSFSDSFHRATR